MSKRATALVILAALVVTHCTRQEPGRCDGQENCACYGNGSCNSGLLCTNDTCRAATTSAQPASSATSQLSDAPASASATPAEAQDAPTRTVARWSAATNDKDANALTDLYADSVLYYGSKQSAKACVASKIQFLAKNPDFKQEVIGELRTEGKDDELRVAFVKRVTVSGHATDYPAYLGLHRTPRGWKITLEGDDVTDAALKKRLDAKSQATGVASGDWDGDGQAESVRMVPPKFPDASAEADFDCVGPCNCKLVFEKLPAIVIENCIGGSPVNEGDLDGDGSDELGLLPDWWTSCWRGYRVYGLRHGQWRLMVEPISTHCQQWSDGVDAIAKDSKHPGHVIVRSMDMSDFTVKSKSVPVNAE